MCNSCLLCWNVLFCLLKQFFNVLHCPTLLFSEYFFNVLECANFCLLQWLWMCWNVQLFCLLTDVFMCWHCNVQFFCLINDIFKGVIFCDSILIINPILDIDIQRWQRKKEGKTGKKKKRKKEREQKIKKCTSMASTDCYKVNIHSYRFCVSYIGDSVSRVGPTRTA